MGWSCTKAASDTLDKWTQKCVAQTGSQNTFKMNDKQYFFETSRTEYDDGHVCGSIYAMSNGRAIRAGNFRINPDGSIAKAPSFLRAA